ncbi:MAG: carboxymuconolactone decarboxylase family protein [Rhodanobacteraceae bacterium]
MIRDWKSLIENMNAGVHSLHQGSPEMMKSFNQMARAAHSGSSLDGKTKELLALALGVSTRCVPCIAYHAEGAVKQGATREEILESLSMAIFMGAGPSAMYAAEALEAFDQFAERNNASRRNTQQ